MSEIYVAVSLAVIASDSIFQFALEAPYKGNPQIKMKRAFILEALTRT